MDVEELATQSSDISEFVMAVSRTADHLWNVAFAGCAVILWQLRNAIFEGQLFTEIMI